ncbi:hypothetical protein DH09_03245 [Bacillaceae bacterium JMAK1]|nr:hypothetical protein DH09_03245 [Bacillaceae bacterium JMAK1]
MGKSKYVWTSAIVATVAAGATYLVKNPDKGRQLMDGAKSRYHKLVGSASNKGSDIPLEQRIGNPDPLDINDNEMVAEGSTFSVDYYNKAHENDPEYGTTSEQKPH